jgi:hypothetical protein
MMRALTTLLFAAACLAQEPVRTSIGIPALVTGVVLEGSEFEPIETTLKSPVVLRIEHMQKHGTANRYALQFTGLEAGEYDLAAFLRRKDRSDNGAMPKIPVIIEAVRDDSQHEPNALQPMKARDVGGYERTMWLLAGAWAIGLLVILFAFRKKKAAQTAPVRKATLADRLRPAVARALDGSLDSEGRAELERLLLSVWRVRLSLQNVPAREAILRLRAHDEAGALLRALDQWLHAKSPQPVDVETLLRPYSTIEDEGGGAA